MKVEVTMFKPSGKWYSSDYLEIPDGIQPWEYVTYLDDQPTLPGLTSTFRDWINRGGSVLIQGTDVVPQLHRFWPPDVVPPKIERGWGQGRLSKAGGV